MGGQKADPPEGETQLLDDHGEGVQAQVQEVLARTSPLRQAFSDVRDLLE